MSYKSFMERCLNRILQVISVTIFNRMILCIYSFFLAEYGVRVFFRLLRSTEISSNEFCVFCLQRILLFYMVHYY